MIDILTRNTQNFESGHLLDQKFLVNLILTVILQPNTRFTGKKKYRLGGEDLGSSVGSPGRILPVK
jgi:hypothetical protein